MTSPSPRPNPIIPPVSWKPSVHHVAPALAAAFALTALTSKSGWSHAFGAGAILSVVAQYAVSRVFPVAAVERYRNIVHRNAAAKASHDEVVVDKQHFHVGFRYVAPDGKGVPHCSLFYPTNEEVTEDESKLPRFAPLNDTRYASGFADYASAPRFLANHHLKVKLHVAVDAALAPSAIERWGTSKHPVVIFSHGLAGHQHMYSNFAADLASMGAIVVCVQHTDGSACFALKPPENVTPLTQHHVEIPYKKPPADDAETGFAFRQQQVRSVRLPELGALLRFAASNQLRSMLSVPPRDDMTPVSIIGHSFGGTTVVSAGVHYAASPVVKVPAVVALDLWTEPISNDDFFDSVDKAASNLPSLLLLDSMQWEKWKLNRENELRLMEKWSKDDPDRASRSFLPGTDHLTLSVMSNIVNLQRPRKPYCVKEDDRKHAAIWAAQAFDFIGSKL